MKRREFLGLVGGSVAAWPRSVRAQQPGLPLIGYLRGPPVAYLSGPWGDSEAPPRTPFLKALEGAGFLVGQNVTIDYRFSEGRDERLPALAAELIQRRVTILVATDRPSSLAARAATATVPIVFHSAEDPVRTGLVQSINHPGGNATGISAMNNELGPKRLGLLREILTKP